MKAEKFGEMLQLGLEDREVEQLAEHDIHDLEAHQQRQENDEPVGHSIS